MVKLRFCCIPVFVAIFMLAGSAQAQAPVAADAYTLSSWPGSNHGNDPFLWVTPASSKSYIRFDLSRLPDTAKGGVTKATARLFVSAVSRPGSFDVFRVTSNWDESTITASTRPNQDSAPVLTGVNVPASAFLSYVSLDITPLVKNWLTDPVQYPNYGIVLQASSGSSISVAFDSKENPLLSHDAQLEVDFVDASVGSSLKDLQDKVTLNQQITNDVQTNLAIEISNRMAADLNETGRAITAEGLLTGALNTEIANRQGADNAETAARMVADAALGSSLSAEMLRAKAAEAALASSSGGGASLPGTPNTITVVDSGDIRPYTTSITIGSDGLPLIMYHTGIASLMVAHCSDRLCGSSTTTGLYGLGAGIGPYNSVTIGTDGMPLIVGPRIIHCTALDCSTVDVTNRNVPNGSVAIGADGLPFVSSTTPSTDLSVFHCTTPACSIISSTIQHLHPALTFPDVLTFPTSAIIGADGLPAIAFTADTDPQNQFSPRGFAFFHCWKKDCGQDSANNDTRGLFVSGVAGSVRSIGPTELVGVGVSAAVDGRGQAVASGLTTQEVRADALTDRELSLMTCPQDWTASTCSAKAGCTAPACPSSVIRDGVVKDINASGAEVYDRLRSGDVTSIAIGRDGLPIVSFTGVPDDQIQTERASIAGRTGLVGVCATIPCKFALIVVQNGVATTVDESSDDVGQFSSITIGTDGLPIISYIDATNKNLKVAHCGTITCNPFTGRNR